MKNVPVLIRMLNEDVMGVIVCDDIEEANRVFKTACAEYDREITDEELEIGHVEFEGGLHNQLDGLSIQLHWSYDSENKQPC